MTRRMFAAQLFALTVTLWSGAAAAEGRTRIAVLAVDGMVTPNCPLILRAAVKQVDGVTKADASLELKRAWVHYRDDATNPDAIIAAIAKNTPYTATLLRVEDVD